MLTLAYIVFLTNFTFGLLVRLRVIESGRMRFVHHGLYALTLASLVAAAVVEGMNAEYGRVWMLAAMGAFLLCMPFFRGWSRGHWVYAVICSVLYSALVFW